MKNLSLSIITVLTSFSTMAATLQPVTTVQPKPAKVQFVLGTIASAGTGCQGGAQVLAEKNGRITVVSPAFEVRGDDALSAFSRSSCNVRIPISVAKNYKLVVREINNSGTYFVDPSNQVKISQKLSFVGGVTQNNPDLQVTGQGNLAWKNSIPGKNLAESLCTSRDAMLALNTNFLLTKAAAESSNSIVNLSQSQFQISAVKCK